jgi:hypothetical protein
MIPRPLALILTTIAALPGAHAAEPTSDRPPLSWSVSTEAGQLTASIERRGKREVLAIALEAEKGVRIMPPVLRLDVPTLVRGRVSGKFPMTVRAAREGAPLRVLLPLTGPLCFAEPDSNDGMLRVEFRHCAGESDRCGVERVDIPLRAGP